MYRVKIGNTEVPNTYIVRGSYNCSIEPRECEKYTDALGIDHIIPFAKTRATINLTLREHSNEEHSSFAALFLNTLNMLVKYWDDKNNAYVEGIFHTKVVWNHRNIIGSDIEYGDTQITLEEY